MNNETENWKLNKIDVLRSIQGMQDMSFPRVQLSIFFSVGACPRTPLYNSCIRGSQYTYFSSDTSA